MIESNHWADIVADRIIRKRGDRFEYTVASGVAPSGKVHFGHLREVMSTELVARALKDRGKQVRFIYFWDDYDVFRKVPNDLPQQDVLAVHLRKPVVDVPDPFGMTSNYAESFENALEIVLPILGIQPDYVYQAKRYRAALYGRSIRTALAARAVIRDILNEYRDQPLSELWWPVTVYSELDGTDNTTILDWDGADTVTYLDVDKKTRQQNIVKSGAVKLLWRVDWPMRWAFENIDFEPAGKDHLSAGGSFDTGAPIARKVYNIRPPETLLYGDVGVKGGAGRISSSAGNAVTIDTVLSVYQPEIVRFLYAGTQPKAEFVVSFDLDVLKIYEDYDRIERMYYGVEDVNEKRQARDRRIYELSQIQKIPTQMPQQVPFRHLCNLLQIRNGDVEATLLALAEQLNLKASANECSSQRLKIRAQCAATWIEIYAPISMRFRLRSVEQEAPEQPEAETGALSELHRELKLLLNHSSATLSTRIYAIAKEQQLEPRKMFSAVYRALIDAERGPRLADFILLSGADRIAPLLAPYTDRRKRRQAL